MPVDQAELKCRPAWRQAVRHATPVSLFMLVLCYYWFAVANRYVIFLYGHLGATPWDPETSSRYWMAGLVAAGMVMIGYIVVNWELGRDAALRRGHYTPPAWWRVWLICLLPLTLGTAAITMTTNWPPLPLSKAIPCILATLAGLAVALTPGELAATDPDRLGWLVLDGLGLAPCLLLFRAIELPALGLVPIQIAYPVAGGVILFGVIWLTIMTILRMWQGDLQTGLTSLLIAGIALSYLLAPLLHYLLFTPPEYHYITSASNLFARRPEVQVMTWSIILLLAAVAVQLRARLQRIYFSEKTITTTSMQTKEMPQ